MDEATCGHRSLFEHHGLRCTRQREAVYDALASTKSHPTAEELHTMVGAVEPGMSLATVYNTLEAFMEAGLVRRLSVGPGPGRYDAVVREHVHLALPDGRVMDLPEDLSERLLDSLPKDVLDELERRLGVRVDGLSIQVAASESAAPST